MYHWDNIQTKRNAYYPKVVQGINKKIVKVAKGSHAAYALDEDGTVWGWGEGRNLQLGLNPAGTAWVPKQSAYASNFTYLSGGKDFMVAIDKLGTMYTAGQNDYGQLGQICHEPRSTDVRIGEKIQVELTDSKIRLNYYQDRSLNKNENVVINFYPEAGSPTQQALFKPTESGCMSAEFNFSGEAGKYRFNIHGNNLSSRTFKLTVLKKQGR